VLLAAAIASGADTSLFRDAVIDDAGQLHITLANGKEVMPPTLEGQTAFESPAISADHLTVGWLADYADSVTPGEVVTLPHALVIYAAGRIVQTFRPDHSFYDWQFRSGGKQVAYSTGPLHGGASECVLAETSSGRVIEKWLVTNDAAPPEWANGLNR